MEKGVMLAGVQHDLKNIAILLKTLKPTLTPGLKVLLEVKGKKPKKSKIRKTELEKAAEQTELFFYVLEQELKKQGCRVIALKKQEFITPPIMDDLAIQNNEKQIKNLKKQKQTEKIKERIKKGERINKKLLIERNQKLFPLQEQHFVKGIIQETPDLAIFGRLHIEGIEKELNTRRIKTKRIFMITPKTNLIEQARKSREHIKRKKEKINKLIKLLKIRKQQMHRK